MDDLVYRDGLYYKKFSDVPFTGKTTGRDQGSLNNGKKVGPWVYFYANGQLWSKGTYKNGKEDGFWSVYLADGTKNKVRSGLYVRGNVFSIFELQVRDGVFYKDGVPFNGKVWGYNQGEFKEGKRDGPWVTYNHLGKQTFFGNYKEGMQDGLWQDYYDNLQQYFSGRSKDGKKYGPWVKYFSDGQIYWKGNYKNGKRDGPWVWYNKFGGLNESMSGTYKNGVKVD